MIFWNVKPTIWYNFEFDEIAILEPTVKSLDLENYILMYDDTLTKKRSIAYHNQMGGNSLPRIKGHMKIKNWAYLGKV